MAIDWVPSLAFLKPVNIVEHGCSELKVRIACNRVGNTAFPCIGVFGPTDSLYIYHCLRRQPTSLTAEKKSLAILTGAGFPGAELTRQLAWHRPSLPIPRNRTSSVATSASPCFFAYECEMLNS